jgi:hypothetical protein
MPVNMSPIGTIVRYRSDFASHTHALTRFQNMGVVTIVEDFVCVLVTEISQFDMWCVCVCVCVSECVLV